MKERAITIEEILGAMKENRLQESFGTGTAAVISPIGELNYKGQIFKINNGVAGDIAKRLYKELQDIQFGRQMDEFHWMVPVA